MHQRLNWLPVGATLVAISMLAACNREREAKPWEHKAEPAAKPAAPKPAAPVAIRDDSLDREAVILAALHALTDAALGRDDAVAQRELR